LKPWTKNTLRNRGVFFVSGFRFQISDFKFQVEQSEMAPWSHWFQISDFKFQVEQSDPALQGKLGAMEPLVSGSNTGNLGFILGVGRI
jgi:hypothetical protein